MHVTNIAGSDTIGVSRVTTRRVVIAVGVAHFINDAYSSFLSPLLPRLMANLGMSIAVAAGLAIDIHTEKRPCESGLNHRDDRGPLPA